MRSPTGGSRKRSHIHAALRPKPGHPEPDETGHPTVLTPRSSTVTMEREHPRYAHEAVVTIHAGSQTHWGRTQNLSRGGLCADLPESIPNGANIDVDIQLVFDDVESEPLRLPARVVWCTTVDEAFQVGLSFRSLSTEQHELLSVFLKYLDDGAPTQRARRESNLDKRFG